MEVRKQNRIAALTTKICSKKAHRQFFHVIGEVLLCILFQSILTHNRAAVKSADNNDNSNSDNTGNPKNLAQNR